MFFSVGSNPSLHNNSYLFEIFRDDFALVYECINCKTLAIEHLYIDKEETIKDKNRLIRRAENFKHDTSRKFNDSIKSVWKTLGKAGINFLNILPKLGKAVYLFLGNIFTDVFNGIYNQQLDPKKAKNVVRVKTSSSYSILGTI